MRRGGKRLLAVGVAGTLLLGVAVAAFVVTLDRRRTQEAALAARSPQARDAERAAFCKDRRRVVHARPPASAPVTVATEFDPSFPTRERLEFKASFVAGQLRRNPRCAAQGVDFIVGEAYLPPASGAAGRASAPRYERIRVCENAPAERGDAFEAGYRLLYGASSAERVAASGDEFATSAVRIVDGRTGAVLAEDTLYFVNNWAGRHAGCPDAREQVAGLLASTFSRRPDAAAQDASPPVQGKP